MLRRPVEAAGLKQTCAGHSGILTLRGHRARERDTANGEPIRDFGAIIHSMFGALGAAAQGGAAYNDWACKVNWRALCPPITAARN